MRHALLCLACCALLAGAEQPRPRPAAWAQPMVGTEVANWHLVSTDLHRAGQPSRADMQVFAAYGIKTVLNLRNFHSDDDEVAGTGLKLVEIATNAGELSYAQLVTALKAIDAAAKPVVVHCWHGADRTGGVVAAYRVAFQGWTPADAADEMSNGGFGHHAMFDNIGTLIRGLDPARLRADVGLKP